MNATPRCPNCGSERTKRVLRKIMEHSGYDSHVCLGCGRTFTKPKNKNG